MSFEEDDAPPVGEEIHLPGPSLLPLLSAKSDRGHLEKYAKAMAKWREDMEALESPERSPIAPQYPVSVLDDLATAMTSFLARVPSSPRPATALPSRPTASV